MSLLDWALFALGVVAISTYAVWWYRTREDPVDGRGVAATLRALALSLAWLLLLDPKLPTALPGAGAASVALLDGSLSMTRPATAGDGRVWDRAVDSLRRSARVWLFGGDVPVPLSADSLPQEPSFTLSRLAPAVRAAAAAGARRVVIVSDGEVSDSAAAVEELRVRSLDASFIRVAPSYPQSGIAGVTASAWVEEGDTASAEVEVVATSGGSDTIRVEIVGEGDRVLASGRVARPAPGRFATLRLSFPLTGPVGYRRLVARLAGDTADLEGRDGLRPFYIQVSERPVGPVLVSLGSGWEPTFLLPDLDRLTDAPVSAYLSLADSLVTLDGYRHVDPAAVRRRAAGAPLLVVLGYGADAPAWARELVRSANRLLLFPAGQRPFTLPGWGIQVAGAADGEWYLSEEIPPSPLALSLGVTGTEDLPPLVRVRRIDAPGAAPVILGRRLRRGEARPLLALGRSGRRRWAIAGAEGYWRWAFRPGAGRSLYRALWAGVGGWLLRDVGGAAAVSGLAPLDRVVPRGEPLRWTVPASADSVTLALTAGDSTLWSGAARAEDTLRVMLPPGRYEYTVRAYPSGAPPQSAAGPAEVEEFAPELLPREGAVVEADFAVSGDGPEAGERGLASLGWPFLVLIALFCAEWAVRRFNGLS